MILSEEVGHKANRKPGNKSKQEEEDRCKHGFDFPFSFQI